MTETTPHPPRGLLALLTDARRPWAYFVAASTMLGLAFSWLARNWSIAQPVIEHPFTMFVGALGFMILGGALIYVFIVIPMRVEIVIPMRAELDRAKADIANLRAAAQQITEEAHREEARLRDELAIASAKIARLETAVEFLRKEMERHHPPPKRSRAPKA